VLIAEQCCVQVPDPHTLQRIRAASQITPDLLRLAREWVQDKISEQSVSPTVNALLVQATTRMQTGSRCRRSRSLSS
jgi:hypothetical protein